MQQCNYGGTINHQSLPLSPPSSPLPPLPPALSLLSACSFRPPRFPRLCSAGSICCSSPEVFVSPHGTNKGFLHGGVSSLPHFRRSRSAVRRLRVSHHCRHCSHSALYLARSSSRRSAFLAFFAFDFSALRVRRIAVHFCGSSWLGLPPPFSPPRCPFPP